MHKLFLLIALICIQFPQLVLANSSFGELHNRFQKDNFTDKELVTLYKKLINNNQRTKKEVTYFLDAIKKPYSPTNSHTGRKFFETLAWYSDMTKGNRNGKFNLRELTKIFNNEAQNYLSLLQEKARDEDRVRSWKMLQKLTLLKREINEREINGLGNYFPYRKKTLSSVNTESPWNKANTIRTKKGFNNKVIETSFSHPVLVKFGLPYCIHCMLLENLGSIPAVANKYDGIINVYKIWWNPKDQNNFMEPNSIASEQGVSSSPYFIFFLDGKQINAGYTFPDERGEGMEDFLAKVL